MTSVAAVSASIGESQVAGVLEQLAANPLVRSIAAAAPPDAKVPSENLHRLRATTLRSAAAAVEVLRWFDTTDASHLLWALSPRIELTATGLRRLAHVAADTQAAILYSDYFDQQPDGATTLHPLIDYQPGSLRDDFDFGQVVLLSRAAVRGLADVIEAERIAADFGGWYDLRLRASERGPVVHLSEPTYAVPAAVERHRRRSPF